MVASKRIDCDFKSSIDYGHDITYHIRHRVVVYLGTFTNERDKDWYMSLKC